MRLIDADELFDFIQKEKAWKQDYMLRYRYDKGKYDAYYEMLDIIKELPTVDAEAVVYCKDCKWFYLFNDRPMCKRTAVNGYGEIYGLVAVKENHYCSYGVKNG